ncbi:hypothetical protein [Streptomyces sp. NPDC091215]|uniref:hypothetical protein n=1 Tax=Streptomyces sp. NPDC091215 TaxID=3155192 RepID=UPI0034438F9B
MTTLIQNKDVRLLTAGIAVARATAALPQTAQSSIFTITGGRILVVALVGEVTTAIQAQATTVQLIGTPTSGTAVNLTNSTGDVNGKEIGATVTLPTTLGGTAVVNNAGGNITPSATWLLLRTGTIDLKTVASSTGSVKWDLLYIPLDTGVSVAAA